MSAKALRTRTGECRLLAELPQVVVDVPIAAAARFSAAHRPEEGWFQYALEQYQLAIDCGDTRPTDVGDATLRWNACVRMIERHPHCVPAPEERAELGLE